MNVFRVAVMKNASRVIAVHNHPSGNLVPSEEDLDLTDRLIQVGKILDIKLDDHLIISTTTYSSFRGNGVMDQLEKSLKYVPPYQVIEKIRKEEKAIAKEALLTEKQKTKKAEKEKEILILALVEKQVSVEDIAKILDVTSNQIRKVVNKK